MYYEKVDALIYECYPRNDLIPRCISDQHIISTLTYLIDDQEMILTKLRSLKWFKLLVHAIVKWPPRSVHLKVTYFVVQLAGWQLTVQNMDKTQQCAECKERIENQQAGSSKFGLNQRPV